MVRRDFIPLVCARWRSEAGKEPRVAEESKDRGPQRLPLPRSIQLICTLWRQSGSWQYGSYVLPLGQCTCLRLNGQWFVFIVWLQSHLVSGELYSS